MESLSKDQENKDGRMAAIDWMAPCVNVKR
jgi:hypothetical protein